MIPDPVEALVARLESRGYVPRPTGPESWESRCPAHGGERRNLSIKRGDDGRALLHCHAHNCSHEAIVSGIDLTVADLFPPDPTRARPSGNGKPKVRSKSDRPAYPTPEAAIEAKARKLGKPTAHWTYHEADGAESFRVYRFDPPEERKEFRPVHRTPEGWAMGDPAGPLPLYRLPELADAARIYLTEGEKAADLARGLGLTATASAHGAKSPHKSDWTPLAGKEVIILPDHDEPGESYAAAVVGLVAALDPRPTVKIVRLADIWRTDEPIPEGGDLAEWLRDGVPDASWTDLDCRVELERLADAAPPVGLDARPELEPPPAEPEADDPEWGPIRLGTLPPAELFPLDVLPGPARELARAASRSIACPIDFPAVAILAAASGLIGRSASLLVKPGYFASALLYLALVGRPSSGKTPALRAALAVVWALSQALFDDWRRERDAHEASPKDERGPEPTLRRIVTTDATTEALGPLLAANERGLIAAPDEMTKWIMSMDQYKGGKGGDRPFYLSVWAGESVYIDRAKHKNEPIVVPHPYLTIVGGMTPDMLTSLPEGRGRDDGLLARLLFAFPERMPRRYSEDGIPEATADDWGRLARALWDRPMRDQDGRPVPSVVRMAPDARREWAEWCHAHYADQERDDFPDELEGAWGKLEAYAARLALILWMMDLACDPTRAVASDLPELPRRIVADAARLVAYFKSHARRVHAAMGGKADDGGPDVRALLRWIARGNLAEFTTRDIGRNFDRFRDDDAALADALARMVRLNLIRPKAEPEAGPKRGRKPAPSFAVNPALLASPRIRRFRRNEPREGLSSETSETRVSP